jgi:hypothetical protein
MDKKTCCLCKQEKEITEFNKKSSSKDGKQDVCRDCNRVKSRAYYKQNHDKHIKAVQSRKKRSVAEVRAKLAEYLLDHPCVDCGFSDIRALEFDHLGDKTNGVASLVKNGNCWPTVVREIEKCEVRCRNCHAIKTYSRLDNCWLNNYAPKALW